MQSPDVYLLIDRQCNILAVLKSGLAFIHPFEGKMASGYVFQC